jgi:hypothetical protein
VAQRTRDAVGWPSPNSTSSKHESGGRPLNRHEVNGAGRQRIPQGRGDGRAALPYAGFKERARGERTKEKQTTTPVRSRVRHTRNLGQRQRTRAKEGKKRRAVERGTEKKLAAAHTTMQKPQVRRETKKTIKNERNGQISHAQKKKPLLQLKQTNKRA